MQTNAKLFKTASSSLATVGSKLVISIFETANSSWTRFETTSCSSSKILVAYYLLQFENTSGILVAPVQK
jgi:hypothetical protein